MTMTESKWQELSDFLAREVMGWETYWSGNLLWWRRPEQGTGLESKVSCWQPHNNLTQAMSVLKTLLKNIGRYAEAELHMLILPNRCRVTIQNWVATDGTPARWVRSQYADNEMQATCLAAKEWVAPHGHKTDPT